MSSRLIPPRVVVPGAAFSAALLTAAALVRVGSLYATVLAMMPLAAAVLVAGRQRVLLAGCILGLAMPTWWVIGSSQITMFRVAAILALIGFITAQRRPRPGLIDALMMALVVDVLLSAFLQSAAVGITSVAFNLVLPGSFYIAARALPVGLQRQVLAVVVAAITLGALTVILERLVGYTLFQIPESYSWLASNGGIFRPGGIYGSPPEASFALTGGILLALSLGNAVSAHQRSILWVSGIVMLLALVLTFERSAMIALGVGFLAYLLLIRRDAATLLRYSVAVILLIIVAVVVFPSAESNPTFKHGVLRDNKNTLAARASIWSQELPVVTSSLRTGAIGVGFGSTILARAGGPIPDALTFSPILVSYSIHNQYLLVLLEQGVAGLVLLLAFMVSLTWSGLRFAARSRDRLAAGMTAFMIALLIESTTTTPVLDRSSWMLTLLVTGLLVTRTSRQRHPEHAYA